MVFNVAAWYHRHAFKWRCFKRYDVTKQDSDHTKIKPRGCSSKRHPQDGIISLPESEQSGSGFEEENIDLPSSWYRDDLRDQEPRRPPGSCRVTSPLRCATVGHSLSQWLLWWWWRLSAVSNMTGTTITRGVDAKKMRTYPPQSESWCTSYQRASLTRT